MINSEETIIFIHKYKRQILGGLFFAFGVLFVILLVMMVIAYVFPDPEPMPVATTTIDVLPQNYWEESDDGLDTTKMKGLRAEEIMFGHFYEPKKDTFRPPVSTLKLPTDVKVSAENYYDISRKIDLSKYAEELGAEGFKVIDNPYKDADDFFSVYNRLVADDVPLIITKDFLLYLYQNNLKESFYEIERTAFYKNVWVIYKSLFEKASKRYSDRLARLGVSNDPVLEGQRMEAAYLAVALSLLTPQPDQISKERMLTDLGNFTVDDVDAYSFELPEYLQKDVSKELQLIRGQKLLERSPVMLYVRDYRQFGVPVELADDAKLYNFYLALKWLSSPFPLYYRSESCPECLLDKDDWRISFTAASFLTQDFFSDQGNKNRWAIIYKFIAYFSGLRQDLTYLDYHKALEAVFGSNPVLEEELKRENFDDIDIVKIQERLEKVSFADIEGRYDRSSGQNYRLGMRLLQESYWPNSFIFSRLTGDTMLSSIADHEQRKLQRTSCDGYRCLGTALDVINLGYSLSGNEDYRRESQYNNYDDQMRYLKGLYSGFNVNSWNSNVYWSTLDIVYKMMASDRSLYQPYMRSQNWIDNKELATALGVWTNIHLPKDTVVSIGNDSDLTGSRSGCDLPNFIEPDMSYAYELMARNQMLLDMLEVLKDGVDYNSISNGLLDMNDKISRVVDINKKLLSGKPQSYTDCSYLHSLASGKQIVSKNNKAFTIGSGSRVLTEYLEGVKLLIALYKSGEETVIAVGPVFDHAEHMRTR